jgi:hypothetical protein
MGDIVTIPMTMFFSLREGMKYRQSLTKVLIIKWIITDLLVRGTEYMSCTDIILLSVTQHWESGAFI